MTISECSCADCGIHPKHSMYDLCFDCLREYPPGPTKQPRPEGHNPTDHIHPLNPDNTMPTVKKAAPKKAAKTAAKKPRGIHISKSSKGFTFSVHANNGNVLADGGGYNAKQNLMKGLAALHKALDRALKDGKYEVVDNTNAAPKKAAPKKAAKK